MATITSIKQRIQQLDAGSFQILCDAYLSREGYPNLVALGTNAGSTKTTQGTPDTYFCLLGDKYVFAEYTTQQTGLPRKIREDLEKCFDSASTGIQANQIAEIVYCHTSANIQPKQDKALKQYCLDHGVILKLIGIDNLSEELYRKYPVIVKEHLGLTIDTEQIRSLSDFVDHYDSNDLSAPLRTVFQYRQHEIKLINSSFERYDIVVLTGVAGAGKTRLALKYAEDYSAENNYQLFVIRNNGLSLFEDLKQYFERPGNYFVIVDDANQISQLGLITEYVNKKSDGYNVKIIITVRSYALEKVRKDLKGNVRYEEVVIGALSDDEIKSIVKGQYGIVNYHYLDRIAQIADGNARIALLAGKIARDTDRLDSISDASGLYDEYFGKAFQEANLEEDKQLQIAAGILAFLNTAHLDHLDPVMPMLSDLGLDISSLKSCIYKLHEMELVDVCHDKAVAISDQCFSNFILKYVFCDKKTVSLANMLDACFEPFHEKTMQAVSTLLNVFRAKPVHDFVAKEIKSVWKKRKDEARGFGEWVKAFYLINQEEALLILKERIDNTDPVVLPAGSIDVNEGKNYQNVSDDIIAMLGGFANTSNLDPALDLFFEYFLKRPDLFIQFYHAINIFFGISSSAIENDFYTPIRLINHFISHSDHWRNEHIQLLFFSVVGEFLQVHFSSCESGRKANSMVICNLTLVPSEGAFLYRNMLWCQLLDIQSKFGCKPKIKSLLRDYPGAVEELSYKIIEKDAPFLDVLVEKGFSTEDVNDCIVIDHLNSITTLAGHKSPVFQKYLSSEKLSLYYLLTGYKITRDLDYLERQAEKDRLITNYLCSAEDSFSAFDKLFEIYADCNNCDAHTLYTVGAGMQRAVNYMLESEENCIYASKKIISLNALDNINVLAIVSRLFSFLSPSDVFSIICDSPKETKDYWLFAYYHEFPEKYISADTVQEFYGYLQSEYDRDLRIDRTRELKFLSRYKKYDPDVFINSVRLIFNKRVYSPYIVSCYLSLLFNSHYCNPASLMLLFENNMPLLEDIFVFESIHHSLTDYDGALLNEICSVDETFGIRYYNDVYAADRYHRQEDNTKLQNILKCKNYISIIDSILEECAKHSKYLYYDLSPVMRIFVVVPQDLIQHSDLWVNYYISEQNRNHEKMQALFEAIAELANENRKISFVRSLIQCNSDPELFSKIDLLPRSFSWSGSAVPMLSGWINYLEKLRPLFPGLSYLKHKTIVNDEIERLRSMIERAEIEDMLKE